MDLVEFLNFLGVFVFALTGALIAARKGMDIFGLVVLALMPAVGGGTLRDLILDVPVFWMVDTTYLFLTLLAATICFVAVRFMNRLRPLLLWLDALGLSVFCALGTAKALAVTGDPVIAVVMGIITAVAGGIVRDVIANDIPLVLQKEVYATAAFAGSLGYVLVAPFAPVLALPTAIVAAFAIRALGIGLGLSLPAVKLD